MSEYLIVDGYNVMKKESVHSLERARLKLLDIMADYQGFKAINVVAVFDAHYVKNSMEKHEMHNGVEVIYTREFERADNYIERLINNIVKDNLVRLVTSDWVEQIVVLGLGAMRVSTREFKIEIEIMRKVMEKDYLKKLELNRNLLEHNLSLDVRLALEKLRRGDK